MRSGKGHNRDGSFCVILTKTKGRTTECPAFLFKNDTEGTVPIVSLEEQRSEGVQVQAPVGPNVTTV